MRSRQGAPQIGHLPGVVRRECTGRRHQVLAGSFGHDCVTGLGLRFKDGQYVKAAFILRCAAPHRCPALVRLCGFAGCVQAALSAVLGPAACPGMVGRTRPQDVGSNLEPCGFVRLIASALVQDGAE
jgi:hypothetical protein